jgi:cytochrome o ubiquinol oxidase operon protein cyoD
MEQNKPSGGEGPAHGNYVSYIAGYILSMILTLIAFSLVYQHNNAGSSSLSHKYLMGALLALAITQLFVQMIFFLHLDRESSPRWNLQAALLAATVVLIIVIGSIWIMNNLNYHQLSPQQMQQYVQQQDSSGL